MLYKGVKKMRKIKRNFHDYIPFILIIVLIFSSILFSYGRSYADNIKVVGDSEALKIVPKDTKMFDLNNLNPGDTYESEIILKNRYNDCYLEIFLRTERASREPGLGEADLFDQLIMSVYLDDVLIYNGSMKDFDTTNTSLGNLENNGSKKMRVIVNLPGKETGNEFQGEEVVANWIFTAQSTCLGETPDPELPMDVEPEVEEPEKGIAEGESPEKPALNKPTDVSKAEVIPKNNFKNEYAYSKGNLYQTGATPNMFYFIIGGLVLVFGMGIYKKD